MATPDRRPAAQLIEEPVTFSTPVKTREPPSFDLAHTPKRSLSYGASSYPRPPERFDTSSMQSLEQQIVEKLRKDGYLLSTLKRALRKDVEEQLHLARREMEVLFSREMRALRDFTNAEVQILSSEMKEFRRERREHTAEALAKLCSDMEMVTKTTSESVSQQTLKAALGDMQQELAELRQGRARDGQSCREDFAKELGEFKQKLSELSSSVSDASRESGSRLVSLEADVARLRSGNAEREGESAEQLRGVQGKVEVLRNDLATLQARMSSTSPEVSDLRGQVKQMASEVANCRRRCEEALSKDLMLPLETATALRLSTIEEQVSQLSTSHLQLMGVREQLTTLTNSARGQSEASSSLNQRFSLLEGEVSEMRSAVRPQEPDQRLRLQQSQFAARLEQLTDQFAAFEEKLAHLLGLAPRLCELERQGSEARRFQEQLQVRLPSAGSDADLRAAERRLEQRQDDANAMHGNAVRDLRNDLITMCSELNDQTLKLANDTFGGCLDRLALLERQMQERVNSDRGVTVTLQSLVDEGCTALDARIRSLESARGQQLSLPTLIEDAANAARRPVEVQLGVVEAELKELRRDRAEISSMVLPRVKMLERQQEDVNSNCRAFEERLLRAETDAAELSDLRGSLSTVVGGIATSVLAGSSLAQEVSQLSARVAPLSASLDRHAEELGSLSARVATLPGDPASSQQVAVLSEEVGGIKARLSALPQEGVASTSAVERCLQQVRSLEDAVKTVSWDLDGAEKQLRELANQFAAVNGNIANLDGQMEIVTGLIHRMDTMARFLQHVQDGMLAEVGGAPSVIEPSTRAQTPTRVER